MCRQVDYIISKIGAGSEKKHITKASGAWSGLNASSILEPIVRLYNITKKETYLDFAEYIVDRGGSDIANIFKQACDCGSTYSFWCVFVIEFNGWILVNVLGFIDDGILYRFEFLILRQRNFWWAF